jgi:predicted RNA-binding Zn-ribbon protein involved in translation (DUF1610 family)
MTTRDAFSKAIKIEERELARVEDIKTPTCPKCGKPLEILDVIRYPGRWEWNRQKGVYDVVTLNPAEEYVCSSCGQVVGGRYGNGSRWGFQPALT